MENRHQNLLGNALGDRSVECYARKLGVLGESIDETRLQSLRHRLSNLLIEEGREVFELFSVCGRESKDFFMNPEAFPYFFRVDRVDPNNPNSRLRIIAVLKGPVFKKTR